MTSEARLILNIGFVALVDGTLLAACALAWWKGGPSERIAAGLYLFSAIGSAALGLVFAGKAIVVPELFLDVLVAVGFLVLAVRYNNLWLGSAMMLKGVQLGLHATHLTEMSDMHIGKYNVYVLSLDAVSVLISLTLLSGVIARRKRAPAGGYIVA